MITGNFVPMLTYSQIISVYHMFFRKLSFILTLIYDLFPPKKTLIFDLACHTSYVCMIWKYWRAFDF